MDKFKLPWSSPAEQHHQNHWEVQDQGQATAGVEDVLDHSPQLTLCLHTAVALEGGEEKVAVSEEY